MCFLTIRKSYKQKKINEIKSENFDFCFHVGDKQKIMWA